MMQRAVNVALGVLLAAGLIMGAKVMLPQTQPASDIHAPARDAG
jgi:hypothetical protein